MKVFFIIMAQGTLISSSRLGGQWDVVFPHPHAYCALAGGTGQHPNLRAWEKCKEGVGKVLVKGCKVQMNREWLLSTVTWETVSLRSVL